MRVYDLEPSHFSLTGNAEPSRQILGQAQRIAGNRKFPPTMIFWDVLGKLLVVVWTCSWTTVAEFTNSFDYATCGSDIKLTWDAVAPNYYPLHITAQLIEKSADGAKATGYKTNITGMSILKGPKGGRVLGDVHVLTMKQSAPRETAFNGREFLTHCVGYRLGYIKSNCALRLGITTSQRYWQSRHSSGFLRRQLTMPPQRYVVESTWLPEHKRCAKRLELDSNTPLVQPSDPPTLVDYQGNKSPPPSVNKPLAIGLGVSFGIPALVTLALLGWCFRRRQRRAMLEKRRLMRSEFIID